MQIRTNASKRDRNHTIELNNEQLRFVRQKFKNMVKSFKHIDAGHILKGLRLHYKTYPDGITRVSFEEPNNGVAYEEDWYTKEQLIP